MKVGGCVCGICDVCLPPLFDPLQPGPFAVIGQRLDEFEKKLDRLLALAGDKPHAAMIDEAIRRAATREAKCQHEPSALPNYCRKCGCQIQAPLGQGLV